MRHENSNQCAHLVGVFTSPPCKNRVKLLCITRSARPRPDQDVTVLSERIVDTEDAKDTALPPNSCAPSRSSNNTAMTMYVCISPKTRISQTGGGCLNRFRKKYHAMISSSLAVKQRHLSARAYTTGTNRSIHTIHTWVSSASVKPVIFFPATKGVPSAALAPTNAVGP